MQANRVFSKIFSGQVICCYDKTTKVKATDINIYVCSSLDSPATFISNGGGAPTSTSCFWKQLMSVRVSNRFHEQRFLVALFLCGGGVISVRPNSSFFDGPTRSSIQQAARRPPHSRNILDFCMHGAFCTALKGCSAA